MLTGLTIRNIVLIEQCELALGRGLCVLTGETGAGKSILLDALGLALGMRAETRLVRAGKDTAQVSAQFDISANLAAQAALASLGLEASDELLIRRTLTPDGKTRCFVNDVPVGVGALKSLGDTLLEIHGQHDGRGLLDTALHKQMLDGYGELEPLCAMVAKAHTHWKECSTALRAAEQAIETALREKDYLLHMQKELGGLAPLPGEEESLAERRTLMMQSEKLTETLNDAKNELASGKGVVGMLSSAQRILTRSQLNATGRFATAIEALERAAHEVTEAEAELGNLLAASLYDPTKLEQTEERLFALRAASRKYNMPVEQLPSLHREVNQKLELLGNQQHALGGLQKQLAEAQALYKAAAEKLSKARVKAAKNLEKAVALELASLKMGATEFKVGLETLPQERWSESGIDELRFQAATNKGAPLAPLHKIASGGELSRFMLAMKVALAKIKSTPTLIFDEIDTGTGGAVADAIGQRLAKLGESHQVLVVTHLAQVAARGNHHLLVHKAERSGATFTQVQTLSPKTREGELARMLAGETVTLEARKAAQKLLQAAV